MAATHRSVLARLGAAPDARLLDTPYGFQRSLYVVPRGTSVPLDRLREERRVGRARSRQQTARRRAARRRVS